jgi:hypothetical protein
MLIAFVGTPCSGKTTTAARVFADLKDAGYPAEFLPETARLYIAERRMVKCDSTPLADCDQDIIFTRQSEMEELLYLSSPESIIVADSAAVNALLYMTEARRASAMLTASEARMAAARYTLVFRCHPVQAGTMYDPNRVHSFAESQELDGLVDPLLTGLELKYISLFGPQQMRSRRAYGAILEAIVNEHSGKVG